MQSKLIHICLFLLISVASYAQDTLAQGVRYFKTDKLNQIYYISTSNVIHKVQTSTGIDYEYHNDLVGAFDYLDTSNPFALLAYASEYSVAIILDRTLNEVARFNLQDLGIWDAKAIALSNDNNIWVYDEVNFQLKKLDQQGKVISGSEDLSVYNGLMLRPDFILEKKNVIYVKDPAKGIYIFDVFGGFNGDKVEVMIENDIQILDNKILYQKENRIQAIYLDAVLEKAINLPEKAPTEFTDFEIQNNTIYLLQEGSIIKFSLK